MQATQPVIHSWIYKSLKYDELYLYLTAENDFSAIPKSLSKRLGKLQLVMNLALSDTRPLAREDVTQVMKNLSDTGFHLQLPEHFSPQMFYGD